MKTIKICFAAFAALMLTASCAKENVIVPESAGTKLVVNAELLQTKTYIEKDGNVYNPFWQEGDQVAVGKHGVTCEAPLGYVTVSELSGGGSKAVLEGSATDITFDGSSWVTIRLLYPSTAWLNASGNYVRFALPEVQHPAANSFDPAADIMFARPSSKTFEITDAKFVRKMAVVRVNLKGAASFSKVSSLKMSVPGQKLAGSYQVETWDETCTMESTATSNFEYVQAVYASGSERKVGVDGENSIYLVVNPVEIAADTEITFELETDDGKVTKTVAVPEGGLTLTAGAVKPIGLTFTTAGKNVVTFESNGGSAIAPASVTTGQPVARPADPSKSCVSLSTGLYKGAILDPDNPSATFAGWFSDSAMTQEYDFSQPVTSNITLYAKWDEPERITLSEDTPRKALNKIAEFTLPSPESYTFVVGEDMEISETIQSNTHANLTFYLVGTKQVRTIKYTGAYAMVNITNGNLVIGKNIKLTAPNLAATKKAVTLTNGTIKMLEGSYITGCNVTNTSLIYVANESGGTSSFTMEGGEISGNTVTTNTQFEGTFKVQYWATLKMTGGVISGNTVTSTHATGVVSGGIAARNSDGNCIQKTGGEIKDNTATGTYKGNNAIIANTGNLDNGVYAIDTNLGVSDGIKDVNKLVGLTGTDVPAPWTRLN